MNSCINLEWLLTVVASVGGSGFIGCASGSPSMNVQRSLESISSFLGALFHCRQGEREGGERKGGGKRMGGRRRKEGGGERGRRVHQSL